MSSLIFGLWNPEKGILEPRPILHPGHQHRARRIPGIGSPGELMTFANPSFDLPPIDRLEAYDPHGRCVYTRVLVAVETNDLIQAVWLYNYKLSHKCGADYLW